MRSTYRKWQWYGDQYAKDKHAGQTGEMECTSANPVHQRDRDHRHDNHNAAYAACGMCCNVLWYSGTCEETEWVVEYLKNIECTFIGEKYGIKSHLLSKWRWADFECGVKRWITLISVCVTFIYFEKARLQFVPQYNQINWSYRVNTRELLW